jgi:membrane-associated HD superfamily phosphohydrolase
LAEPRQSRSEARNAAARAQLEPLREGERPVPVTIGALVLAALAIANVVWFATGSKIGGAHEPRVLAYSALMGVVAVGMWLVRYWAVLLMQALLTIVMLLFSLLAMEASNVQSALLCIVLIVASGALFWSPVKAMARIQMPERGAPE